MRYGISGDFFMMRHQQSKLLLLQSISQLKEAYSQYEKGSIVTIDFVPRAIDIDQLVNQYIHWSIN